ncbi:hypothetical protein RclHR1_25500002 [Rhizophagus clarus]|uniref:Uncharacterized protein n=1 Tax=Rhizophagus clarus TaxID=94130 RepID=A0A2Z6RTX6_9GLOM|nr:hypothetical protein RclHR1_25500002 [Rhizophagus clarus]GES98109.1 hypothetical protein RCL_jg16374.t1 [Rhizophagus clarus]
MNNGRLPVSDISVNYNNIPHNNDNNSYQPNVASNNGVNDHSQQYQDTLNINPQSTPDNILPQQIYPPQTNQNAPQQYNILHNNTQQTIIFNSYSTNNSVLMQSCTCFKYSSLPTNNSQN